MIREICKDEAFLARKAEPASPEDLQTAADLLETLEHHKDGCVGMAANMIGVNKRIIAFDDEGTIANVIGMDNTETPGLGTKVQLPDFTDQFLGRAAEPLTIDDIDAVTGATISSKAALAAVNEATTVPSESTTATFWPAEPLTVANAKGCSPLVKFCAIPLEPTMSTVPPVTVAVRS